MLRCLQTIIGVISCEDDNLPVLLRRQLLSFKKIYEIRINFLKVLQACKLRDGQEQLRIYKSALSFCYG